MARKCPSLHQAWLAAASSFHASSSSHPLRHDDPEEPSSSYSKDSLIYTNDNPLYALVRMMTALKQKRKSANEYYVRRVLREQIGFTEYDVDRIWNSPVERHVFQLSVRNNIEPVVSYLKSLDITGSALVSILAEEPLILSKPVDDHIIPIVTWLFNVVGNQAPAVLLRCPNLILQVTPQQLGAMQVAVSAIQSGDGLLRHLVWEYPQEFIVVCRMPPHQQQEVVPKMISLERDGRLRIDDILNDIQK